MVSVVAFFKFVIFFLALKERLDIGEVLPVPVAIHFVPDGREDDRLILLGEQGSTDGDKIQGVFRKNAFYGKGIVKSKAELFPKRQRPAKIPDIALDFPSLT